MSMKKKKWWRNGNSIRERKWNVEENIQMAYEESRRRRILKKETMSIQYSSEEIWRNEENMINMKWKKMMKKGNIN